MTLGKPLVSVCIATYNKAALLAKALDSVFRQNPPFQYEVIVCNDGSTDNTREVCGHRNVIYLETNRLNWCNPSVPRNMTYRRARGNIIVAQSDEVVHQTQDSLDRFVKALRLGEAVLATVFDADPDTLKQNRCYVGDGRHSRSSFPGLLFFLGALWRKDLYAVGGNDEEFTKHSSEDTWFGECLINGLGLSWRVLPDVVGLHLSHSRNVKSEGVATMRGLLGKKMSDARCGVGAWCSSGGPWPYVEEPDGTL